MSTNRLVSIIIVVIPHLFLGYALVTGLAYEAVKKAAEKMNVVDVKEEEPPEEEEPPPEPEKQIEPPVVSPPPLVKTVSPPPTVQTVSDPPPSISLVPKAAPPAPAAPPPPPPPVAKRPKPVPKGNPGNWANTNDYPARALQQEREGVTRFSVTVGANGRVTGCSITGSSGHADLDQVTCSKITSRGRFDPALDGSGQPTSGTWSSSVRWQIPK